MKYTIYVPTEENNNFWMGPVILREDGKGMAFCNVHGKGESCLQEVLTALDWPEENWLDGEAVEDMKREVSEEGMFTVIEHEVAQ